MIYHMTKQDLDFELHCSWNLIMILQQRVPSLTTNESVFGKIIIKFLLRLPKNNNNKLKKRIILFNLFD